MKHKRTLLLILILLITLACNLPTAPGAQVNPGSPSNWLVTADPNAAPTPTPFQPVAPTPTGEAPMVTETATEVPPPVEDVTPTSPAPTASPYIDGQVRIMLLGSDWRPNSGFRTDVMMLVSINPKEGTATVLSFPRDLYVFIPGRGSYDRLNTPMAYGGFQMFSDTLEYNFGIRPDYYLITNFQGFVGIIDSLNGIYVNVGSTLTDSCDLPQAVDGYCTVTPGQQIMDGATALWYVRSRHTSSDLDRTRRAQEVMLGLFKRLMSFNAVLRAGDLYQRYKSSVETNLGLDEMLKLVPIAPGLINDTSLIRRYAIGYEQVTPYTVPETGAMVLLPNYDLIYPIIQQAVFTP